ncbi:MAG: amidohydrolase [Alphaproteobacteria bacterium]
MNDTKAQTILTGGRIWCGARAGFAQALAIRDGRVAAVASNADGLAGPGTRSIDLRGRLAVPGFYDAHMHLLPLGLAQREVDVRPEAAPTMDDLIARVRERAAGLAPGEWIYGRGYDHFLLPGRRHPSRDALDRAAPDNPVYLKRCCGHMGVANTRALELAGIDEATPEPDGGHIGREDGRLTGLLQERAQGAVFAAMPPPSPDDLVAAIEDGGRRLLSNGITSAMDAGVGMRAGFAEIEAYRRALSERRLPVRAYLCLLGGPEGIVEEAHARGLVTGAGDERMKVGPVKLFTDGSAGGRTAAMREPYLGDDGGRGIFCYADEEVNAMALDYHAKGYQLGVHAIGDAAIDQTLAAVRSALDKAPAEGRRHRIEHCGYIHSEQIAEMKRLGMVPVPQPVFMYQFGDAYVDVLGEARPASAYPMASWIRAGLRPAMSSDAPVSDFSPFLNLYAALTRASATGRVLGADERIGVADALTAMTYNGAYASFDERGRGTLEAGKAADVAVLSDDVFRIDLEEILETRADLTLLAGEVVHDRLGEVAD